eukprot:TRINITY_DN2594_c0_g1_i1.p1 TRINITY_DN2594_c0_g1~~TRINITY_DN2594_c0_g1_i1.p1  ORF type:complete len:676 (+),score=181.11 TRINITY_DN2594_c0_g1_i1:32-2029(+)
MSDDLHTNSIKQYLIDPITKSLFSNTTVTNDYGFSFSGVRLKKWLSTNAYCPCCKQPMDYFSTRQNLLLNEIMKKLSFISINLPESNGYNKLGTAIIHNTDFIRLYINNGADINCCEAGPGNATPLHIAVSNSQFYALEILLEAGANPNVQDLEGNTPLLLSCIHGKSDYVKYLLKYHADIHIVNKGGFNALFAACEHGYWDIVDLLLNKGADPNFRDENGVSCLHAAIKFPETLEVLLKNKADINVRWEGEMTFTPLLYAIEQGILQSTEVLLRFGANPFEKCDDYSSLHLATLAGALDVMQLLLDFEVDVDSTLEDGETPLFIACSNGNREAVVLLAQHGASINVVTKSGYTTLHAAVIGGNRPTLRYALASGISPNSRGEEGITPLHEAAEAGNLDFVRMLVRKGAKVDAYDDFNFTPLHVAAFNGHLTIVEYLLKLCKNIDLNKNPSPISLAVDQGHLDVVSYLLNFRLSVDVPYKGHSPLAIAIKNNNVALTELLLENGANPNIRFEEIDMDVLLFAIAHGYEEIATLLLNFDANPNPIDKFNHSALHTAAHFGYLSILKKLLSADANVNATNVNGKTPLFSAIETGQFDCVKLLLECGCDPNIADNMKDTPLHYAVMFNQFETVKILLNFQAVSMQNSEGLFPVDLAVQQGFEDIVKLL